MSDLEQNQQNSDPAKKPKGKLGGSRQNSGGARAGAGRPKGVQELRNALMTKVLSEYKITPLQYMLAVLNGEHEDARGPADRQWAANAAAPCSSAVRTTMGVARAADANRRHLQRRRSASSSNLRFRQSAWLRRRHSIGHPSPLPAPLHVFDPGRHGASQVLTLARTMRMAVLLGAWLRVYGPLRCCAVS
jgi:hypothetical protein